MKFQIKLLLSVLFSTMLTVSAMSDDTVNGTITKLSGDCKSMLVTTNDTPPKEISINNDKNTKMDIDGRSGSITMLKMNMKVTVTVHNGGSIQIVGTTPKSK